MPLRELIFPVFRALGPVIMCFGMTMLLLVGVSAFAKDGAQGAFWTGFACTMAAGALMTLATRRFKTELTARHGFLLVTLAWTAVPLFAAIPLSIELPQYSFARLYFETMSCLTTTGSTMLTGLDDLPLSVNGLRCFLSWIGGMGLIVLSVAILPLLGIGGAQVMKAETSGPLKENKLTPRIADTAKALWLIYFGLSFVLTIAFHLAGMSWRNAVLYMMSTVSLSGNAVHDAGFAFFTEPMIDVVAIVSMVICGFNFSLHFAACRRRSLLPYLRDRESLGWILTLLFVVAVTVATLHLTGTYGTFRESLLYGSFAAVSLCSTASLALADYSLWPNGLPVLLLVSAAFASCAGSTGGGLKMIRILIILKHVSREALRILYPKAVLLLRLGDTPIEDGVAASVFSYVLLWLISVIAGALVLLLTGMPTLEALTAAYGCFTNLGTGFGAIGPSGSYAVLSDLQLGLCAAMMLLGRLEIFTVFILFTGHFWKT